MSGDNGGWSTRVIDRCAPQPILHTPYTSKDSEAWPPPENAVRIAVYGLYHDVSSFLRILKSCENS